MDKVTKYVKDLTRKIEMYNEVYDQLDTRSGMGVSISAGIEYDIKHLINLLKEEGKVVVLNQPERGHWSLVEVIDRK